MVLKSYRYYVIIAISVALPEKILLLNYFQILISLEYVNIVFTYTGITLH